MTVAERAAGGAAVAAAPGELKPGVVERPRMAVCRALCGGPPTQAPGGAAVGFRLSR